jgi:glycosyltransferase involved in cell wall biosynthesis
MHIFIPVYFNAPLGGLQSHVKAIVKAILCAGHTCTVMCNPGPFANTLVNMGIAVLETTYHSLDESVGQAMKRDPFDLVHAHPFSSRKVGLMVARKQGIPFLLTFHGTYLDSLKEYHKEVDFIITVSDAIRDYLSQRGSFPVERIFTIPNGVETSLFHKTDTTWDEVLQHYSVLADKIYTPQDRRLLFVSRFDKDKQFVLDTVKETWNKVKETKSFDLVWLVVGDGTLRADLEAYAAEINLLAGRELIIFMGWQNEESLARLYNACHLTIGPGRCVIESMACGTPAVAVGSKGYVGLIDISSWTKGVYENFGGFGSKYDLYSLDAMFNDIDSVIYDDNALKDLGQLSERTVKAFF